MSTDNFFLFALKDFIGSLAIKALSLGDGIVLWRLLRLFTRCVHVYESSFTCVSKTTFQAFDVSGIRHFILNLLVV